MLTASNYNAVQAAVMGNIQGYLTYMMGCKSTVQRQIMDQLSPSEINDIRDCRLNQNVVNKLAQLGKQYYNNGQKSDQYLYCVCMSVGTICSFLILVDCLPVLSPIEVDSVYTYS